MVDESVMSEEDLLSLSALLAVLASKKKIDTSEIVPSDDWGCHLVHHEALLLACSR